MRCETDGFESSSRNLEKFRGVDWQKEPGPTFRLQSKLSGPGPSSPILVRGYTNVSMIVSMYYCVQYCHGRYDSLAVSVYTYPLTKDLRL